MRFIYLIQTEDGRNPYRLPPGRDFLTLGWGAKCDGADEAIHLPNSSWMEGRNLLFQQALLRDNYDYFIFLDDDLQFPSKHTSPDGYSQLVEVLLKHFVSLKFYQAFQALLDIITNNIECETAWFEALERSLARHSPLVATCNSFGHPWDKSSRSLRAIDTVSYGDHGCLAVHWSAASKLLPYENCKSKKNWWFSSEIFHQRAYREFPDKVVRFNRLTWVNSAHRAYPQDQSGWRLPRNVMGRAPRFDGTHAQREYPNSHAGHAAGIGWDNVSIVVTTIFPPTEALTMLGAEARGRGSSVIAVGDQKTPSDFRCSGVDFYSLERQQHLGFALAKELPRNHYCRKNIGYLIAIAAGARHLLETDDDNLPLSDFWASRETSLNSRVVPGQGWINTYRYFTERNIWPRGLPHDRIAFAPAPHDEFFVDAPIQQGLAQSDPDVDAIHRITNFEAQYFSEDRPIFLREHQWSPINSQNTLWDLSTTAPLLYLPATCNMRETDIVRGFVAQRLIWTLGMGVLFHKATVLQKRNAHDLLSDFRLEERLYRLAPKMAEHLSSLTLPPGIEHVEQNMLVCYEELIRIGIVQAEELSLLQLWMIDVASASGAVESPLVANEG